MNLCDVCHERKSVGVACSATGAVSFAYCAECAASGREPYGAVVASLYGIADFDDVAEWYRPSILATLKAEDKTIEELFIDVAKFAQAYEDIMHCVGEQGEEVVMHYVGEQEEDDITHVCTS